MNRQIAHITIEAVTPLKVGSNAIDSFLDSPIQRDFNGLPMILGTSIAGVLRNSFDGDGNDVFGNDDGSKVIISNALLLDENEKVNEKLLLEKSDFLKLFDNLVVREHTAITDKGVAKERLKYDEEVVYAGSRFKFSIELVDSTVEVFEDLLNLLSSSTFRLGGGSTKGFGELKILKISKETFDTESYMDFSTSLNHKLSNTFIPSKKIKNLFTKYTLTLKPDNFFMFGSGFGDEDADMTPVYEQKIDYENKKMSKQWILIPASSIKGAISHRVAFKYNKSIGATIESNTGKTGEHNLAVKDIFGCAKEGYNGEKGKILISDCYLDKTSEKVFDHVTIDRFTGGALDGALFQEKTVADCDEFEVAIYLKHNVKQEYISAFEATLDDICTGMLPLGGATTKGHGVFIGKWESK